ncbi:MAG TPA: hypothetical protein VHM90_01900 [Phycisphaerae bacterium]|jgi:hypothetical protein|nr:hypothetical protein [Phycisphaerae bacterium]
MNDLQARVARLEKSAARWRMAAVSLLLLGAGAVSMGQITLGGGTGGMRAPLITADEYVVNKSITVNDSNGKPRLVLSTENDIPTIRFKDKDNKPLLIISTDPKTQSIVIQDADGKKLAGLP